MLKAKDVMTADVITVSPETGILEAVKLMLDNRINGLPVMDDQDRLVGIICQSDLIAQQKSIPLPSLFSLLDAFIPLSSSKHLDEEVQKIAAITVDQAMTRDPVTVTPETGLEEIAGLMTDKKFHTLPVMDEGELVGVIGKEDILRTLAPATETN